MAGIIAILGLGLIILNYKLSKWLFNDNRKTLSDTDGENIHRWGLGIIGIICAIPILVTGAGTGNDYADMGFWLFVFTLVFGFQAFMEWKYLESIQYVIPIILLVLSLVSVVGAFYINDQMKYTTFREVVSDKLNGDTTLRSIAIYINDLDTQERVARTTIKNQEIIDRVLEDMLGMELKKVDGDRIHREYTVEFVVTNQVEEDHYSTESMDVELGKNHLTAEGYHGVYKIVSKTDHLKTIESLVGNDEVEWKYYGD